MTLKVKKANAMLLKLRHVLEIKTLRLVIMPYLSPIYAILHLFLAQNTNSFKRLHLL